MKSDRSFVFKSAFSVADQLLLSGLNFLIGVALIRYATKETYGLYSQVMAAGVLSTSILFALIGAALTTLAMRLEPLARSHMVARVARLHWLAAAIWALLASVAIGVLDVLMQLHESPLPLALSFGLWLWTLAAREYCRTALFIEGSPERVALVDFTFVVLTMVGAVAVLWVDRVTVAEILFVMALANGFAALLPSLALLRKLPQAVARHVYAQDAKALWAMSRWAVVGALLGWMGNNSYLYLAGGLVGVAALADLNAARLVLMPIAILGTAWAQIAQPAMGKFIAEREWGRLKGFMLKSILAMEGFTALYIAVLALLYPWLSAHFLGAKYQGVLGLMLLWGGYFAVNAARTMGTVLLTSFGAFRALFWQGAASLVVLLGLSWFLIPKFGVAGALAAMVVVELFELATNHAYLLPMVRRKYLETSHT